MKLPTIFPPGANLRRAAFTLTEMMVALAVLSVGTSIAYPFLITQMNLYVRNFSINKSNNSLRKSVLLLQRDIDMAVAPPTLATYAGSGSTATIVPLPDSTLSADAILVYVNFGSAYNMPSVTQDHKTAITNPVLGVTLVGKFITASGTDQQKGMPSVGDRLLIMSPSPSSSTMLDTNNYNKPGRQITKVTPISNDSTNGCRFTLTLALNPAGSPKGTPLPGTGTTADPYPDGDQSVYLLHESAYMTYTVTNGTDNVEKQLLYVENTANLASPKILIHDLDTDPKEVVSGAAVKPFNYAAGGRGTFSATSINLPIRAFDYAHAIAERGVAAGQVNVSSEFNVFIRSAPTMYTKYPIR